MTFMEGSVNRAAIPLSATFMISWSQVAIMQNRFHPITLYCLYYKDAFTPELYGSLELNQGLFPQIVWYVWGGVKAHSITGADQTRKL